MRGDGAAGGRALHVRARGLAAPGRRAGRDGDRPQRLVDGRAPQRLRGPDADRRGRRRVAGPVDARRLPRPRPGVALQLPVVVVARPGLGHDQPHHVDDRGGPRRRPAPSPPSSSRRGPTEPDAMERSNFNTIAVLRRRRPATRWRPTRCPAPFTARRAARARPSPSTTRRVPRLRPSGCAADARSWRLTSVHCPRQRLAHGPAWRSPRRLGSREATGASSARWPSRAALAAGSDRVRGARPATRRRVASQQELCVGAARRAPAAAVDDDDAAVAVGAAARDDRRRAPGGPTSRTRCAGDSSAALASSPAVASPLCRS